MKAVCRTKLNAILFYLTFHCIQRAFIFLVLHSFYIDMAAWRASLSSTLVPLRNPPMHYHSRQNMPSLYPPLEKLLFETTTQKIEIMYLYLFW